MMDYDELRNHRPLLNAIEIRTELAKLTLNELYKASRDPAMHLYATAITEEAARRYFHSGK